MGTGLSDYGAWCEQIVSADAEPEEGGGTLGDLLPAPGPGALATAMRRQLLAIALAAINRRSPLERNVLMLRFGGWSYANIGKAFGMSYDRAKRTYERALAAVKSEPEVVKAAAELARPRGAEKVGSEVLPMPVEIATASMETTRDVLAA